MSKFVQTVHTNFHAKSGLCGSRNERVMLNFAIWRPFCFSNFVKKWVSYAKFCDLAAILFLKNFSKFVQILQTNFHTKSGPVNFNFHAKSGLCSSRNEWVLLNFVIWRPFCFLKFCQNLFRLSIPTSIQNLESVAQKMSKLWHLVQKRTDIYLSSIFKRLYSPNFISHILKVWTKEQKPK